MDNFQIQTAQNVTISQNVAGIGERILAYIIDSVLIIIYLFVVFYLFSVVEIADDSYFLIAMTIGLPLLLYHLLWETFWNGQSPGKAALNLRVVMIDGSKPSFSNFLLRWLLRLIDISLTSGGVAVVTILLNGKGQRLGDIAATTTVISEKKTVSLSSIQMVEFSADYVPKYQQVTVFNDKDIQTIKSVYYNAKTYNNHHLILRLSERVSKVMDTPFDEKPINFVERVIKDYTFLTQK
ncbi:RDD family protein [uncultured Planktosalinus sp.]|uniref:RDD family protein n=1 Tax=uncultured Planktosalinus sp. TaxID=1810935 RepID=UPI0030DD04E9|tara:strand:- start:31 stop:744 length:714 start_codon:yes stop_codon:yes gene_type:complete